MKRKKVNLRRTKNFSIAVPIGLTREIRLAAKAEGRTVSGFISWLIYLQKKADEN
jgi:hypothetical protein